MFPELHPKFPNLRIKVRSNWTMLCIFPKILAGHKGIKSPLITADALFWWEIYYSLLGTPCTPWGKASWGGNSGEAAWVEEPNQISFPGGDFNLNDRKTGNTLMSRSVFVITCQEKEWSLFCGFLRQFLNYWASNSNPSWYLSCCSSFGYNMTKRKLWVAPLFPNDHFVTSFTNVQLCHLRKENS